jgi:hypothetical protein
MSETENKIKPSLVLALVVPVIICLYQLIHFYMLNMNELGLGFPIDDGYIFKRYATNIASGNGFSFNPGETSFGCTSWLWPVLAALVHKIFFFADYVSAVFWLGGVLCTSSVVISSYVVYRATKSVGPALLCGVIASLSVNIVLMHGVSGMETSLTIFLFSVFALIMLSKNPRPVIAGIVAGFITLNRPEGLYFPLAFISCWMLSRFFKERKIPVTSLIKFMVPWVLLAVPLAIFVYKQTGSFLPGTYLGKMMSSDPNLLERGALERMFFSVLSFGDGWIKMLVPYRVLGYILVPCALYEIYTRLRLFIKNESAAWPVMGTVVISGFFALPGVYGFSFPVHPAFGGYYNRYITPVLVFLIIISIMGGWRLISAGAKKIKTFTDYGKAFVPVVVVIIILYAGWTWYHQFKSALLVYRSEVSLNTGIRMDAAKWIADENNVGKDAKVMVGYTGLGVVGGECQRYVLDLGALINPDIYDYYLDASNSEAKRWDKMVDYMRDRGISYYVTFPGVLADPAQTPGFNVVKKIGEHTDPNAKYDQIFIYKIDWEENKKAASPGGP